MAKSMIFCKHCESDCHNQGSDIIGKTVGYNFLNYLHENTGLSNEPPRPKGRWSISHCE
jgi:hypothetical protein